MPTALRFALLACLLVACTEDYPREEAPWKDDVLCGPACPPEPEAFACRMEAACATWQCEDDVCATGGRREVEEFAVCTADRAAVENAWIADCSAMMVATCGSSWVCSAGCLPDVAGDACAQASE